MWFSALYIDASSPGYLTMTEPLFLGASLLLQYPYFICSLSLSRRSLGYFCLHYLLLGAIILSIVYYNYFNSIFINLCCLKLYKGSSFALSVMPYEFRSSHYKLMFLESHKQNESLNSEDSSNSNRTNISKSVVEQIMEAMSTSELQALVTRLCRELKRLQTAATVDVARKVRFLESARPSTIFGKFGNPC